MKLDWKPLAARVDDMSLRERAMLFGALSLVVLFLAYVALIDPGLRRQKSLIDRLGRDQHQIAEVRGQLEQLVRSGGAYALAEKGVAYVFYLAVERHFIVAGTSAKPTSS